MWIIGLLLLVLSLGVLWEKLPGNETSWLIVLICAVAIVVLAAVPTIPIHWPRRRAE